jgi:hypothetical protein
MAGRIADSLCASLRPSIQPTTLRKAHKSFRIHLVDK